MHVGIAGEVRCVVTKTDGTVKEDTGFQKNLILNQGLDFFGGGKGNNINTSCAIGSGNSVPVVTQTKLEVYIAQVNGTDTTSDYSYVDKGDNLYHMWEQKKYRFTGLNNVNISEVGLVSTGTSNTDYYLTTRALIKDSSGAPTSISVLTGETLDIYYKIHKVIDTRDKAFVINMLDGNGGAVPYNVIVRPASVGDAAYNSLISSNAITSTGSIDTLGSGSITAITSYPSETYRSLLSDIKFQGYTTGSYKIVRYINYALGDAVFNIKNALLRTKLGYWQVSFSNVSDGTGIPKTANDTLEIPFEFSWVRYEGAL